MDRGADIGMGLDRHSLQHYDEAALENDSAICAGRPE